MAPFRAVALGLGAAAIALLVSGVVLGAWAPTPNCDDAPNIITCEKRGFERLQTTILLLWGAGIAATIAGMAVWGLHLRQAKRQPPAPGRAR